MCGSNRPKELAPFDDGATTRRMRSVESPAQRGHEPIGGDFRLWGVQEPARRPGRTPGRPARDHP